jgi:uncharacterized protein (TIGR00369 family)
MEKPFRDISKVGFIKHNGGLKFRKISDTEYEFRTTLQEYHMNSAGMTHGGFIMAALDSGMGTAAHQVIDGKAATISLQTNFIGASKPGEELVGYAKIKKQTKTLIFMYGELKVNNQLVASAEGIWKVIRV